MNAARRFFLDGVAPPKPDGKYTPPPGINGTGGVGGGGVPGTFGSFVGVDGGFGTKSVIENARGVYSRPGGVPISGSVDGADGGVTPATVNENARVLSDTRGYDSTTRDCKDNGVVICGVFCDGIAV